MLIDSDTVAAEDVVLVGARNLDPPEESSSLRAAFASGRSASRALDGVDAVYVAFDCDVLEPDCGVAMFMPEPGGMTPEAAEPCSTTWRGTSRSRASASRLVADPANVAGLARFCAAVGL
jgi:arginase family enzyme